MLKLWTVQDLSVLDCVNKYGVYYPDFKKSYYLNIDQDLDWIYQYLLISYNYANKSNYNGLVFAFMGDNGEYISGFPSYDFFKSYITNKKDVIKSLWQWLNRPGSLILELEYNDNFNPIFIDINDFQYIMPPQIIIPPFNNKSMAKILFNISHGVYELSEFPSSLYQVHVGKISKENIVGIYPMFEI